MDDEPISTEEKIINATIACLEQFGVQGTTNRKIAEVAGINSAAVNYYFRSKDILVQKAMERTMDNAFDWSDFAELPGDTPQEHCIAILDDLIKGGLNFPGITRAHFHDLLTTGNYDAVVVKRLNQFVQNLCDDLESRGLKRSRADLEMACIQLTNSVFMAILVPHLYQTKFGLDLSDSKIRSRFVRSLVEKLL